MSASLNLKLGLLVVLGLLAGAAAVLVLGLREPASDTYHTYFDESVQGLERGAVVKYRGVRIGKVSSIGVAPDLELVDVELAISRDSSRAIDLSRADLRAQLVVFGITGVKLIDLDFASPTTPKPPTLKFAPPARYIPSQPSLLERLERSAVTTVDRLPELIDRGIATLDKIDRIADDVHREDLPRRAGQLADAARVAVRDAGHAMRKLDRVFDRETAGRIGTTLGALERSAKQLETFLDHINGGGDLERTLQDVGDAARKLRTFLDVLERQPDMLVKGRRTRP
jgi:phospholipid/cholesterol/gamma-HCH transport system substrate-binding protein